MKEFIKNLFLLPKDIQIYLREFGIVQVNNYLVCTNKISKNRIQSFQKKYLEDVIQPVELSDTDNDKIFSVNSLHQISQENSLRREFFTTSSPIICLSRYRMEYREYTNFKEFIYEYVMDQNNIYLTFTYVYDNNLQNINSTYDKLGFTSFSIS
jgi:hypothetical protein